MLPKTPYSGKAIPVKRGGWNVSAGGLYGGGPKKESRGAMLVRLVKEKKDHPKEKKDEPFRALAPLKSQSTSC